MGMNQGCYIWLCGTDSDVATEDEWSRVTVLNLPLALRTVAEPDWLKLSIESLGDRRAAPGNSERSGGIARHNNDITPTYEIRLEPFFFDNDDYWGLYELLTIQDIFRFKNVFLCFYGDGQDLGTVWPHADLYANSNFCIKVTLTGWSVEPSDEEALSVLTLSLRNFKKLPRRTS